MRYLHNSLHQEPGGPIFIYIGGEWPIRDDKVSSGHLVDMASEFNGSVYYTEHRYYGKSRPTEDSSTENLKFLTIEQALEDLAEFIKFLKITNPDLRNSKVLLAGGSYPGGLAVWMRQKYPHLVDAAWASSAILTARLDFQDFKKGMTEAIRTVGGEDCKRNFADAFKEVERLIDAGNTSFIKEQFSACSDFKIPQDASVFMYELSECIAHLIQFDAGWKIREACDDFGEIEDKLEVLSNRCGGTWICLENDYENYIKKYQDTDWESDINLQSK